MKKEIKSLSCMLVFCFSLTLCYSPSAQKTQQIADDLVNVLNQHARRFVLFDYEGQDSYRVIAQNLITFWTDATHDSLKVQYLEVFTNHKGDRTSTWRNYSFAFVDIDSFEYSSALSSMPSKDHDTFESSSLSIKSKVDGSNTVGFNLEDSASKISEINQLLKQLKMQYRH